MPWHTDKTAIYEDCAPKKAAFHVKLEVIQYKIKIQKKPFFKFHPILTEVVKQLKFLRSFSWISVTSNSNTLNSSVLPNVCLKIVFWHNHLAETNLGQKHVGSTFLQQMLRPCSIRAFLHYITLWRQFHHGKGLMGKTLSSYVSNMYIILWVTSSFLLFFNK